MSRYLFILLYLISFNTSADWQIFSELGFWDFCNPDPTSVLQSKLDECVASRTYCAIFNLDPPECIESPPGSGGYINFSPVSFGEIMYKFDDPCPLPDQFLNQNTGQCDTPCPNNADQIRHEYPTDLATNPSWNDNPASSLSVDGCGYQLGGDGMEECYWKGNIVYCSAPYTPTGEPLAEGPESPQPDSPGDNDGIGKKSQDDIVTVTQEATRKENDSPAAGDTTTSDQTTEVTSVGTTTEIKTDLITSKGGQEITKTTTTTTRALSDGTTQTTTNTTYSDTGTTGITIVPSTGVRTTTSTPATSGTTTTTTSTGADGSQTTVQTTSGTGGDGQRGSGTGQQAEGEGEGEEDEPASPWSPPADTTLEISDTGWWESSYPGGMSEIWSDKQAQLMQSGLIADVLTLSTGLPSGGSCPSFQLPVMGTGYDLSPPCFVWDFVGLFMIASACFYSIKMIW